jgi:hypothetical protein
MSFRFAKIEPGLATGLLHSCRDYSLVLNAEATPPISTPKPINESMGRLFAAIEACGCAGPPKSIGVGSPSLVELPPGPAVGFFTVNCTVEAEPGTGVPLASTNTTLIV